MSPADFKNCMSPSLIYAHVACRLEEIALSHATMFFKALSHVNKFIVASRISKEQPCHPVEFRAQGP